MDSPHADAADLAWRLDSDWIAPVLWRSEFRNTLAGAMRQRSLTVESALEIANLAEAMMAGNELIVSTEIVMRLIAGSNCSAYDCEFVALAEEQNVPLVTVDRAVLRAFPKTAVALDRFAQR
jgi:predicted nucleic acid-binding protein